MVVGWLVALVAAVGAAALVFLSLGGSTGWVVAVSAAFLFGFVRELALRLQLGGRAVCLGLRGGVCVGGGFS